MRHFWDDPRSRLLVIDLVEDQIILQPCVNDLLAEEAWSRPVVVTVPRSSDEASLGRMAQAMLAMCLVIERESTPNPPEDLPDLEIDKSELPEFMGGTWQPPPPQPPTEQELARWEAEERRMSWPSTLKKRLAGVSSDADYVRNKLHCSLLHSRGQFQVAPYSMTRCDGDGRYLEEDCILLADDASETDLGRAIRTALERARNPWLPFLSLFRTLEEKRESPRLPWHPLDVTPEWIPSNLSFLHGHTMDRKRFWELIQITCPTPYDPAQHRDNLAGTLGELAPKEIASFEKHYLDLADELYDVRVVEVMWVLSGGGPGDEGWTLFTSWLILQGRKKFEQVLKTPDRIPELFLQGTDIYGDGIGISRLASDAYEESTGRDDFDDYYEAIYGVYQSPDAPRGAKQDPRTESEEVLEERLRKKYPDLWKHLGHFD